jgi:hypothetical protein
MPRASAPRSFALRPADVTTEDPRRPVGAFARAPALLGSLAVVAFLAFGSLVLVDLSSGSAGDGADDSGGASLRYDEEQDASEGPVAADSDTGDIATGGSEESEGDGEALAPLAPSEYRVGDSVTPQAAAPEAPPSAEPETASPAVDDDGDDDGTLRAAQVATAVAGVAAAGGAFALSRRRRS